MSRLTGARRSKLKAGTFGMPSERKYPMPDKSHAANAKARASQQRAKGNLSADQEAAINAKADRMLGKSGGMDASERALSEFARRKAKK